MNYRVMNRLVLLALAVLVSSLMIAGCGSNDQEINTDPGQADGGSQDSATTLPDNEIQGEDSNQGQEQEQDQGPDYARMNPSEYGVKDIFFDFDKYNLDAEDMRILSDNARILRQAGVKIMISGHCDERGTVEYNIGLGEKRAKAVYDYLVSLGVPSRNLTFTSYGKSKPFAYGHDEAAWAKNRRAHFERP